MCQELLLSETNSTNHSENDSLFSIYKESILTAEQIKIILEITYSICENRGYNYSELFL